MHATYEVYVVGETLTPIIEAMDLLIIISGSENTKKAYLHAVSAQLLKHAVFVITNIESTIARIVNLEVIILTKKFLVDTPT